MDKFSFDFFEFFGAVVPGIPLFILGCFFYNTLPFSFDLITNTASKLDLSETSIIILSCYCIGFCMHHPSYEVFKRLVKLWGTKRTLNLEISLGKRETELVNIRHNSVENFKVINKFMALRQMSYTMFLSLVICGIGLLFNETYNRTFYYAIMICVFFAYLFLRRAVNFHHRIQVMISSTTRFLT